MISFPYLNSQVDSKPRPVIQATAWEYGGNYDQ